MGQVNTIGNNTGKKLKDGTYHKQAPHNLLQVNGELYRIPAAHTQVLIEIAGEQVFLINMKTGVRVCELIRDATCGTARVSL